jgi:hypothetical protein
MRNPIGMVRRRRGLSVVLAAVLAVLASGCAVGSPVGSGSAGGPPAGKPPVYVHYYLWWTPQHWSDKLGPSYPMSASPLPLPGTLGPDGCSASANYSGATITDIPTEGLYDQNDPSTFDRHIATAAAAGVRGFTVSWQGTGSAGSVVLRIQQASRPARRSRQRVQRRACGAVQPRARSLGLRQLQPSVV